jgi:tetratricopeptide (TPR) repeat protein
MPTKTTPKNAASARFGSLQSRVQNAISLSSKTAKVSKSFLDRASKQKDPADQAFWMGMAAYEAKDFCSAREFLQQSFELKPNAETAARLSMTGYRSKDLRFAEKWIRTALEMDAQGVFRAHVLGFDVNYRSVLAIVLVELGQTSEGVAMAEAVIASTPDPVSLRARAMARLDGGDTKGAQTDLEKALKFAPDTLTSEITTDIELIRRLRESNLGGVPFVSGRIICAWPV